MLLTIAAATAVLLAWLWLCVVLAQPAIAVYLWAPIPDAYITDTLDEYRSLNATTPNHGEEPPHS